MPKDEYLVKTPHDGDWFYSHAELEAGLTRRQLDHAWPVRKDSETNWTTLGALFPRIIAEQKSYQPPKDAHCYLLRNGKQEGPFIPEQIRNMWSAGQITVDALYWFDGLEDWFPVKNFCDAPPVPSRIRDQRESSVAHAATRRKQPVAET